MKWLLFLTMLSTIAAGSTGCRSRGAACRPVCAPAPACCGGVEAYSTPGTVITTPGVMLPQATGIQTVPGPETYAPVTGP
jgi:hypothetical protein